MIADDLTGAADSGVQLLRSGYRTAVFFQGEPVDGAGLDAVVVDTDSRSLPPESARERVFEAVSATGATDLVFKKVDSTLRGNLRKEIEAAMEATGRRRAVVAPAFPGGGRTTVEGTQLVHGKPVHHTEISTDPRTPVREGHIPTLLAGLGPLQHLGSRELQDASRVGRALDDCRCLVADATEDEHLQALVEAIPEPSEVLWAGSAGLTLALGGAYPGDRPPGSESAPPARNALVAVGSLNPVSREQLRVLLRGGLRGVELAASPDDPGATRVEDAISGLRVALERGESAALYSPSDSGGTKPEAVAQAMAEAVRRTGPDSFEALALTGGDTAAAVARGLRASGIELLGEVEAGVPVGRLIGPRPYPVVTKAGGFGGRDTLQNALKALVRDSEER